MSHTGGDHKELVKNKKRKLKTQAPVGKKKC